MHPEEQQTTGFHAGTATMFISVPEPTHISGSRPDLHIVTPSVDADAEASWMTFLATGQQQKLSRVLYSLVFKRIFDVVAASAMLLFLAPLLAVVALVIRLESPGQVVYRQMRVGRNGDLFTIYKFRTMIPDRRQRAVPISIEDRRKQHKTARDPRVTKVGRFLRRTSIDELPQLFNILKGDMSFIGPRPELPQIVERYQEWQHQRHLVTPGLSGWWQVTGRSDLPMHEHTDLDIYYVVNQSITLDAKIVLRTFKALLSRGGAF